MQTTAGTAILVASLCLAGCGENKLAEKPADEWTGVALSAAAGDIAAIEKHLAGGADINAKDLIGGNTLLNITSLHGQLKATEWLIEKSAKVDMPNNDGATALYLASSLCHSEVAALLLEKGADVNHKNNQGATPLDSVTWKWNQSLRDLYVAVGPMLHMEIDDGASGLHRFIDKDHAEWTMVVKDAAGDVVADLSAKQTRLTTAGEKAEKTEKAGVPVPERSAEQEVLGRFVGEWKEVVTNKGEAPSSTMVSRYWSRSGKGTVVHQEGVESSRGWEHALIWRYDSENEVYRFAHLFPTGWSIVDGTWDEKSETMTWSHPVNNSVGHSGSGTYRFIDKDHGEWAMINMNPAGEVVLDLSITSTRVEPAGEK